MDYRSPIEAYTHEPMIKEMEDGIMRATISCGVQIDKDELIRALAYDREQYRAGYEAAEKKYKRPTGEWMETEAWPHNVYCSNCKKTYAQTHWPVWEDGSLPRRFCPNCGADMRGAADR